MGGSWAGTGAEALGLESQDTREGRETVLGPGAKLLRKPVAPSVVCVCVRGVCVCVAGVGTEEKGVHQRKITSLEATLVQAEVAFPLTRVGGPSSSTPTILATTPRAAEQEKRTCPHLTRGQVQPGSPPACLRAFALARPSPDAILPLALLGTPGSSSHFCFWLTSPLRREVRLDLSHCASDWCPFTVPPQKHSSPP